MSDTAIIPLSAKEAEGLLWGLGQILDYVDEIATDSQDPLFVLRAKGWKNSGIARSAEDLIEVCYLNGLPERVTKLETDILRCCVENSSWITTYRTNAPTMHSTPHINEALAALRSLAGKLEKLGIAINHIPFD